MQCRPEVNIEPWDKEFRSIKEGSQALDWTEKHPTAHWKGNPDVDSPVRTELLHCNESRSWGAEIMRQVKFSKHTTTSLSIWIWCYGMSYLLSTSRISCVDRHRHLFCMTELGRRSEIWF